MAFVPLKAFSLIFFPPNCPMNDFPLKNWVKISRISLINFGQKPGDFNSKKNKIQFLQRNIKIIQLTLLIDRPAIRIYHMLMVGKCLPFAELLHIPFWTSVSSTQMLILKIYSLFPADSVKIFVLKHPFCFRLVCSVLFCSLYQIIHIHNNFAFLGQIFSIFFFWAQFVFSSIWTQ